AGRQSTISSTIQTNSRSTQSVQSAIRTREGAGFLVKRAFPSRNRSRLAAFDPRDRKSDTYEKRAWPHRSPVRRKTMSIIDKALEANRNYAKSYDPTLGRRPTPKIAVVTCMDPRLSDLSGILGLPQPDIDVIRTGGPAVTEDVLAELIVSNR